MDWDWSKYFPCSGLTGLSQNCFSFFRHFIVIKYINIIAPHPDPAGCRTLGSALLRVMCGAVVNVTFAALYVMWAL